MELQVSTASVTDMSGGCKIGLWLIPSPGSRGRVWLERGGQEFISRSGPSSKSETAMFRLRWARGAIGAEFAFRRHGLTGTAANWVMGVDAREAPLELELHWSVHGRPATRISCADLR